MARDKTEHLLRRIEALERRVLLLSGQPVRCTCQWVPLIRQPVKGTHQLICTNDMCGNKGPEADSESDAVFGWNEHVWRKPQR